MTPLLIGAMLGWLAAPGDKTQTVRALDIILLGPFMVWAASTPRLSRNTRMMLSAAGAATITYNARNYLVHQEP